MYSFVRCPLISFPGLLSSCPRSFPASQSVQLQTSSLSLSLSLPEFFLSDAKLFGAHLNLHTHTHYFT